MSVWGVAPDRFPDAAEDVSRQVRFSSENVRNGSVTGPATSSLGPSAGYTSASRSNFPVLLTRCSMRTPSFSISVRCRFVTGVPSDATT